MLEEEQISFRSASLMFDGIEDYSHQIAEMIGLRNESNFIHAGVGNYLLFVRIHMLNMVFVLLFWLSFSMVHQSISFVLLLFSMVVGLQLTYCHVPNFYKLVGSMPKYRPICRVSCCKKTKHKKVKGKRTPLTINREAC